MTMTRTTMGHRARLFMLGGLVLAAGCTSVADDAADETTDDPTTLGFDATGETVTASETFANPDADDFNLLLPSQPDLTDLTPVDVLDVSVADDAENRLIVSFEMGSHECFGVETLVAETANVVSIEVLAGVRPGVSPVNCELGVYPYTTELVLDAPLGDRVLGAAEPREPEVAAEIDEAAPTGSIGEVEVLPAADDAPALVGEYVEDGVEWALNNGVEWRIVSMDGEPMESEGENPDRIGFVVERDRIVELVWG